MSTAAVSDHTDFRSVALQFSSHVQRTRINNIAVDMCPGEHLVTGRSIINNEPQVSINQR